MRFRGRRFLFVVIACSKIDCGDRSVSILEIMELYNLNWYVNCISEKLYKKEKAIKPFNPETDVREKAASPDLYFLV